MQPSADQTDFINKWNDLDRRDRMRLRRLARIGKPAENAAEAELIVAYAEFQRNRLWTRWFWVWFVPGVLIALGTAMQMHPIVIGIVIVFAGQAVFARINLKRTEKVNAVLLTA